VFRGQLGVFLSHFGINLRQTRMQYSNDGPQHCNGAQFSKKSFLNVVLCRRKTVTCPFRTSISSNTAAVQLASIDQ